jgi:hypothetical protein
VTTSELIPAVIAIMTDRQDDARGRPKDYIKDKEKRWSLFGHDDYDDSLITPDKEVNAHPPFEISVYLNCVRLIRRIDHFLDTPNLRLDAEAKRNIRFYLAKYAACAAIANAHCPAVEISRMNVDSITDESLRAYLTIVRRIYRSHGGNDDAGRSHKMSAALKKNLSRRFSKGKIGEKKDG